MSFYTRTVSSGRLWFNWRISRCICLRWSFSLWRPFVSHNRAEQRIGFAFPGFAFCFDYAPFD